jgi:hypothetical protein
MTTKYEDIGKEGNDLLSRGFPSNTVKISFENTFPEGFDLKTNIDRSFRDNKEAVSVSFEPTFSFKNYKLKSKLLTKPEKEVSFEAKNLLTSGSLFEVGTSEKSKSYFGSVGFSDSKVNLSAKVTYPHDSAADKAEITGHVYGVLNYPKDIYWGAYVNLKKPALGPADAKVETDLNGRIHFANNNTTIFFDHVLGAKAPHQLGLLWTQRVNDTTQVATKYTTTTDLNVAPTLEAVLEQKGENGSTFKAKTSVCKKEKADNLDMKLGFSYSNKFSDRASYTFGADFNARELFGARAQDGVGLGFEVKLK